MNPPSDPNDSENNSFWFAKLLASLPTTQLTIWLGICILVLVSGVAVAVGRSDNFRVEIKNGGFSMSLGGIKEGGKSNN